MHGEKRNCQGLNAARPMRTVVLLMAENRPVFPVPSGGCGENGKAEKILSGGGRGGCAVDDLERPAPPVLDSPHRDVLS